MKAETVSIYVLSDPRTNAPFYVGKTCQPLGLRLRCHLDVAIRKNNPTQRAIKIRELHAVGLKPAIDTIERVERDDWQEAERFWIEYLRFFGVKLSNETKGGEGSSDGCSARWTPELDAQLGVVADAIVAEQAGCTRKAVVYRRSVLGIPASYDLSRMKPPPPMGGWNAKQFTEEQLARLGTAPDHVIAKELETEKSVIMRLRKSRGIKSHAEQTGKTGQFSKGHKNSLGVKRSEETKAKLSAWKRTPEMCAKMAAAQTGKKASPETRAKMSVSQRLRRQQEANED